MRFFSVPIGTSVSSRMLSTAASMAAGSMSGSSPWMLTMTSAGAAEATSATRSVPDAWSSRVILTGAPKDRAASAIRMSSVAMMTWERYRAGARTFKDVLQHRLTGNDREGFTWEAGRREPGWNNPQNSGRHVRS